MSLLSDSDDDDTLLNLSVFGKRSSRQADRAREKKSRQTLAKLDELVKSTSKESASILRIHEIRQQDLELQVQVAANERAAEERTAEAKKRLLRREVSPESLFETEDDEEIPAAKRRRAHMIEDAQDEASTQWGLRMLIELNMRDESPFFFSCHQAREALAKIVGEASLTAESTGVSVADKICNTLTDLGIVNPINKQPCQEFSADVVKWLIKLLQSAGLGDLEILAQGALVTVDTLLDTKRIDVKDYFPGLDHFLESLSYWLNVEGTPCKAEKSNSITKGHEEQSESASNAEGLLNLIVLWTRIIQLIPELNPESLSKCVLAVILIGMDVSANPRLTDIGMGSAVENLLAEMVKAAARESLNKPELYQDWCHKTASMVCNRVTKLGPGLPGRDDEDDESGWLLLAKATRLIPRKTSKGLELRIAVAANALSLLQGSPFDLNKVSQLFPEKRQSILQDAKDSSSLQALIYSYTSLVTLDIDKDADFPKSMAIADCSYLAFQSALFLLMDGKGGYVREADAVHVLCVTVLLRKELERLCEVSNRFAGSDHMRRFNYLILLRNNIIRMTLPQLKDCIGVRKPIGQTTLDSFLESTGVSVESPSGSNGLNEKTVA